MMYNICMQTPRFTEVVESFDCGYCGRHVDGDGCTNHCPGCFNPASWDFAAGTPFTDDIINNIIDLCRKDTIAGLSVLGGEPMNVRNQEGISKLVKKFKKELPNKNIWMWSGYNWEDMQEGGKVNTIYTKEILSCVDVLVDGPFVETQKSLRLKYKGSKNQRLLDLKATEEKGKPVLFRQPRKS